MSDWIFMPIETVQGVLISIVLLYLVLITLTRTFGIRSFSKMSGFDFAVTVAFGSVLASIVVAKDPPVLQGAVALFGLFLLQFMFAWARNKSSLINSLVSNEPRLIMAKGKINKKQLRLARMTEGDLMGKLREANVLQLEQVEAVIAETTGDVSVLHHDGSDTVLDDCLLDGIIGADFYRPNV